MSHYVHHAIEGGRRWNAGGSGRELSALGHELRAILTMLEHRRRWPTSIVPFSLVAHARRLMEAFEDYAREPPDDAARGVEAAELRERLTGVEEAFRTTGSVRPGRVS